MDKKVIKTEFGYFSINNLPTQLELEKYYQTESTQYSYIYSEDELTYFDNTAKVAYYIYSKFTEKLNGKLLEVGRGEGFFANHFLDKNWYVRTLDYSDFGIKKHNPNLLKTLTKGDIYKSIDSLILKKSKYDLINLSNVLEHVIDPIKLLNKFKLLLSNESLLRISVPNDYSKFQKFLLEKDYTVNTWLCPPDHLHYFSFESLSKLLESLGYEIELSMGEFPIELFISNESSNYTKNKKIGKFAHKSRIEVDNFIFNEGITKYVNFYKASAAVGLSRQVIIYVKLRR